MAINNQQASAGQNYQELLRQAGPTSNASPSVLRLVATKVGSESIYQSPASKEAYESADHVTKERSGVDAFTPSELKKADETRKDLDKLAKEGAKKAGRLLQNGQLHNEAEQFKDATLIQLLKEALPDGIKQAIKEKTGGKNDPEAVFAKAENSPVKVAKILGQIYPQQIKEMLDEAKEKGDEDSATNLEAILKNMSSVFNIAEMENLGEAQHMALLGHVAELSERGKLSEAVSGLVELAHKSYTKLAENEDRITGVLTKISRDISETLGLGPKGDKHLRNKVAVITGAMISDHQANGSIFNFNDDEAISHAVPFEPEMLNAPGLSAVTTRLLSKQIAPAWNRIYVGHLTQEQPYANIAMLDTPDHWIPNDANV